MRADNVEQKPRKILIVDDEEAVRALAAASIEHALGEAWQVCYAGSGEQALAVVAQERPDLVLLDILMPGMDGFEVCRRLKASSDTSAIPIIFLTAVGHEPAVAEALRLGGEGYIIKPFNAIALAALIAETLARQAR